MNSNFILSLYKSLMVIFSVSFACVHTDTHVFIFVYVCAHTKTLILTEISVLFSSAFKAAVSV